MAELMGSPKQVAWATDIIKQRQAQAQTIITALESADVWNEDDVELGGPNGVYEGVMRVNNCMTPQEFIGSVVRTRVPKAIAQDGIRNVVNALTHDEVCAMDSARDIIDSSREGKTVTRIAIDAWVRNIAQRDGYESVPVF